MKKFGIILSQDGGCDYTIGCGKKIVWLSATTEEEAIKEARDYAVGIPDYEEQEEYDKGGYHGESELSSLVLISFEQNLPLKSWYAEYKEKEKALEDQDKNEKDRIEYERLKKKFSST